MKNMLLLINIIMIVSYPIKADNLKDSFKYIDIVKWGIIPNFDMIINATSIGLKENDEIKLDFSKFEKDKIFYDVIYNPRQTNFLKKAKNFGHKTVNIM